MNQIRLTADQIACMGSDGDWLKLTPEQEKFVLGCPRDHVVMLLDNTLVRIDGNRAASAMATAFGVACEAAAKTLGLTRNEQVADIRCDTPILGTQFLRVTMRDLSGREASAIGMIPDPRAH
jgi:hypothetical protein